MIIKKNLKILKSIVLDFYEYPKSVKKGIHS